MVVFNYSGKEINAKVVYYGPGLSGKTTNLEQIFGQVPETRRGKMVSMKTRSDRTLFFDFLPVNAGQIKGFDTRFLLYTVPGQVHYNATRKLVLKGTDAIIFVADSDPALRQANRESMANLEQNLAEYQLSTAKIPVILQFNKRDLPNALSVDQLNADLNPRGWPFFEAVAVKGDGVWETFRAAIDALFKSLERTLSGENGEAEGEKSQGGKETAGELPDPRFAGAAEAGGPRGPGDEVVRVSASIEQWAKTGGTADGRSRPAGEKDHEKPVRREGDSAALGEEGRTGEQCPAPEGRVTLHGRVESYDDPLLREGAGAGASPGRSPQGGVEENPLVRREPGTALRSGSAERPPVAQETPRAEVSTGSPASGVRKDDEERRVVRVPISLDAGSGTVRIEIALEIAIQDRREREQVKETVLVDTGGEWK